MTEHIHSISLSRAGFTQRCPRCGKGKLFTGILRIADQCSECGLVLHKEDAGDGPAFFAIVIVGFIVTTLAAIVEFRFEPPFWLHAVLWIPAVLLLSLLVLRVSKSMLIASQYKHQLLQ